MFLIHPSVSSQVTTSPSYKMCKTSNRLAAESCKRSTPSSGQTRGWTGSTVIGEALTKLQKDVSRGKPQFLSNSIIRGSINSKFLHE